MKMHGVQHGCVRVVCIGPRGLGFAMVKVEFGLEELVELRCSVAPAHVRLLSDISLHWLSRRDDSFTCVLQASQH